MRNLFLFVVLLLLLGTGAYFFLQNKKPVTKPISEKKTPHWESNVPEHSSILPAVPVNVVIYFNFDISSKSNMMIENSRTDYGVGNTQVDSDKRTMRRAFDEKAPDGKYQVSYTACWPDGSCDDGNFEFAIDRSRSLDFIDRTGQKEVTINLKDTSFEPANVKVSSGTKITWVNDEQIQHYVSTDPHPGHNYFKEQNSVLLNLGDKYSVTIVKRGFYPYHCSAHISIMGGGIIVE